ncbi:MAG: hypothetical protein QGH40_16345 [bacterium]|jgi:hypothetical protein|nr:hypothetical protein [bacterium]
MIVDPLSQYQNMLPLACQWVEEQEALILRKGHSLSPDLLPYAERIGIDHLDRVRVLPIASIPLPQNPVLMKTCRQIQLITPQTAGLAMRYGIYVRLDCTTNVNVLIHELVHVAQYEKLGGIFQFLQRYLFEIVAVGYPNGPLEQEAAKLTREICESERALGHQSQD